MAENDVVYSYEADSSGIMDSIDSIMGGINELVGSINELVDASSSLGEFSGIFEEIASIFSEVDAAAGEASAGISAMAEEAGAAGEALASVEADAESLAEIGAAADEAVAGIGGIVEEADAAAGALDAMASEAVAGIGGVTDAASEASASLSAMSSEAVDGIGGVGDAMASAGNQSNLFTNFLGSAKEGLSGFLGGIGDTVGGMIDFGVQAGQNVFWLQMIGNMAVQAAQSLLLPGENAQQMQAAFTNLLGSTQAATNELQQLDAFASKTPFQTMDIDQAASQLVGFGTKAQDVVPDLTAIGDAISAVGKGSVANLDGVVNIFGKIQLQGKLTAADMTQMSDRGINAWGILEQQTGKTQAQLAKMITAGLIPAGTAIKDLTQGIEKNPLYQGGMQKQSQTFAGIMSTVKSNFDQALASFDAPILKSLGPLFNNIGNALASPAFKDFAGSLGQGLVNTFRDLGNFIESLDLGKIGGDFAYLGQQLGIVAPNGAQVKTILSDIGGVIKGVVDGAGNLARGIGDVVKWFKQGSEPAKAVGDAIAAIAIAIAAVQLGSFLATIPALIAGFGAWAVSAGAAAIATIAATWPLLAIGAVIAAVVFGIIEAVQHWGQITNWLKGVWSGFSSWFEGALHAIGGFFTKIWDGIKSGLQTAWNAIVNVIKVGALVAFAVLFAPFVAIGALFVWLYNHNTYFKRLIDAIISVFKAGIAWIQSAWSDVIAWLGALWNGVVKTATDVWNTVSKAIHDGFFAAIGFVEGIWNDISSFFVNAWDTYIAGPLHTLWTNVSGVFSSAWNTYISKPIGDLWTSLTTTIDGWAGKAVAWGGNLIQGFVNGIVAKAGSVASAIGGIAGKVLAFLGFHSPTKEGPGSTADQWAPALMNMFIDGIQERQARLKQVVEGTAKILSDSLNTQLSSSISANLSSIGPNPASFPQGPSAAYNGNAPGSSQTQQQMLAALQGIQRQLISSPTSANLGAFTQNFGGMNFHGVQNVDELYQILNVLQGQQFEQGQRGALFNN